MSIKVKTGAIGIDEREGGISLDHELLEGKVAFHLCVCFCGDASQIFMNIGPEDESSWRLSGKNIRIAHLDSSYSN